MKYLAALVLLIAPALHAQTFGPVITEVKLKPGKTYNGTAMFASTSLKPLAVTVEAQSFTVDKNGITKFRPLDPNVHVSFTQNSASVGVNQNFSFDYKATCDKLPCSFVIYSSTIIGHNSKGEQVKLKLPSTVYICPPKEKACRDDIKAAMAKQ